MLQLGQSVDHLFDFFVELHCRLSANQPLTPPPRTARGRGAAGMGVT